jgi:type IV pilus assembly protein PilN
MKVRLNLATKAQASHRRFLVAASAVGIVVGIVFLSLGWHVYVVRRVDERFRAQTEDIRRKMVDLQAQRTELEHFFSLPENARLHDRAAFLNTMIDARSLNWTQMFMDLERIMPGGVHLLSIEPKQVKGRVEVKLTVGATSDEAKLKFLRALEESKQFSSIALDSQRSPTTPQAGGDQTTVQLTAVYSRI